MVCFACFVIISLQLCICHVVIPSITISNGRIVSNDVWSEDSTQSAVANDYRRLFSPAKNGGKLNPLYSSWKIAASPKPPDQNGMYVDAKKQETIIDDSADISRMIDQYLATELRKYKSVNQRYLWATKAPYEKKNEIENPDYQWTLKVTYAKNLEIGNQDHQRKSEDGHQCTSYEDCQLELKNSHCVYENGRRVCSCSENYIKFGNECLLKVLDGTKCNESIQCVARLSVCYQGYCKCLYRNYCLTGFSRRLPSQQHFIWPYVIPSICIAMLSIILGLILHEVRRKNSRRRIVTLSELGQRTNFESGVEHMDKPPSYDELVSTPTAVLNSSELIQMPPPNYTTIQQTQQKTTSEN